ncbi:Type I inositol 3,4-bisphosphate 4-phosphatase [Gryganskiella cystojenkinii]|nr:Type I inositol 3,4-bisphosphate 4-phosphatase [Gryganskiella cystojenkinii]
MSSQHSIPSLLQSAPLRLQPKNASALAPIVFVDATTMGIGSDSVSSLPDTPVDQHSLRSSSSRRNLHSTTLNSDSEQSPDRDVAQTLKSTSDSEATTRALDGQTSPLEQALTRGPPLQLRASIAIDQDKQLQEKLVQAKVQLVLVLAALVQLPDHRQTWLEQSRTELMVLDKNVLVIGFTLLVVPSPNTSAKVLSEYPSLDGFLPWAEASVAVEHFVTGQTTSRGHDHANSESGTDPATQFSVPLIEISLSSEGDHKKRKTTIATLTIVVEESLPIVTPAKVNAERSRIGPSFSQTYYGHSVRGSVLYARESLYESPLAFTLPVKLLQFLAEDEDRVLQELEREQDVSLSDLVQSVPLDHRPNPITRGVSFMETLRRSASRHEPDVSRLSTKARQAGLSNEDSQLQKLIRQQISAHRNIKGFYESMILKVEQRLRDNFETGQGPFRRSPEKKDESVQWIPINCCVQDLLVHDDGHQVNYKFTTVGAAAAHGAGFARGSGASKLGNAHPMGNYWDKQEKGQDLIRDLEALREVLASSANEYTSLIAEAPEIQDKDRIQAIVKETRFLVVEIVSFGTYLLDEFLAQESAEGFGQFIRSEINEIVTRLRKMDLSDCEESNQESGPPLSAVWTAHIKRSIKDILACTNDLVGFVAVAVQLECLVTDSETVAGPEWITEKRTRECCFSQATTALATAFSALLEDWWCEMSQALQIKANRASPMAADHRSAGGMDQIAKESNVDGSPARASLDIQHGAQTTMTDPSLNKAEARRPSLQSTLSGGSTHSTRRKHGRVDRSKPDSVHPLEGIPSAKAQNEAFWDQLSTLGWLVQIESLLSTQGSELGMLLDYLQAIVDVRTSVSVGFHARLTKVIAEADGSTTDGRIGDDSIQISGRRGKLTLSFGLDPLQFSLLPDALRAGTSSIRIIPVLFSQGINEMQTLSNLTGKSPVQRAINEKGLRQMQNFVSRYQEWQTQRRAAQEQSQRLRDKSRIREYGPSATGSNLGHLSNTSLLSDLGADWDMVSPSGAEMWHGEPLVGELLDRLEMAILGRDDDISQLVDESVEITESGDVHLNYPSPRDEASGATRARTKSGSEPNPGLLGTVVEYGTSRLFSARATKDVNILQCAEALTRALGQVRPPFSTHGAPLTSVAVDHVRGVTELSDMSSSTLLSSSLWVTSHVVSCKSAKDRTSMAVTLSQANLLRVCHGLQAYQEQNGGDDWQAILDAMRSEVGVRIKNVERNLKLGVFAKDLLWLSAFSSSSQPVSEDQVFDNMHSINHETPEMKDAVSYIRSLIPGTAPVSMSEQDPGRQNSQSSTLIDDNLSSPRSLGFDAEDDESVTVVDRDLSAEGSVPSRVLQTIVPVSPNSPPPLLPESTVEPASVLPVTEPSPVQENEFNDGLAGDVPAMVDDTSSINNSVSGSSLSMETRPSAVQEEHYTSFPNGFDEPQFSDRIARKLGLDSRGRSSIITSDTLPRNDSSQSVSQNGDQNCQPVSSESHTSLKLRPTPSWSSQQSIYFQLQQQPQLLQAPNNKRMSTFGIGLGFLTKSNKGESSSSTFSKPLQHPPPASNQRPSLGVLGRESTLSTDLSSPLCSNASSSVGIVDATGGGHQDRASKKGKFAFNKLQLKFLPAAYRPPRRMTTNVFES